MSNIFDLFKQIERQSPPDPRPVEYIVVGLGNPGKEYERTRHNAGFRALSLLCERTGAPVERSRFQGLCTQATLGGARVLFLRPQTYMNHSGESVAAAAEFYKIPPERIVVIFDDTALNVGTLRVKRSGSAGGHNGIKSIIAHLGTEAFPRVKIGVGKKPHPDYVLADWVLSKFTQSEEQELAPIFVRAAEATELICAGKLDQAMNLYNRSAQ